MENKSIFTRCLISNTEDLYPLKGYERHYLVKSKSSGFVFCNKIPTQQELYNHYLTYNREDYLSPVTIKRLNEVLDSFEPYRKTNKILDIGCGVGFMLEQAKKRGWDVYGTEYTEKAIEICEAKGIKMSKGKLDPAWFENESFDVITSLEVIEHINNPIEEVGHFRNLLRKGGLLYFTTPNFNAIERFILKDQYNIIGYPEHLCYYTPRTINYLLSKNGFSKKGLLTTGFSVTRIKTSTGQSNEGLISATSSDELIRNKLEDNPFFSIAKKLLNKTLTLLGIGNSLKGWYVKN
jgi:2-polyprenyl-3-methyl-5-hydroxy-6-metoxy-1,4-benzoquinol methylase